MTSVTALEASLRQRFRVACATVRAGRESYELLHPASAEELISETDFEQDERLPYWAEIWPSAIALAGRVEAWAHPAAACLELGCGVGLVAAAATRAGLDVTATDYYEPALEFTRVNTWRNAGHEPVTLLLDWRALAPTLPQYDLVLASDVLYERPYAALVARTLARTLTPAGRGVLADPGRIGAGSFVEECRGVGLRATVAERVPFEAGSIQQAIALYEVRRAIA